MKAHWHFRQTAMMVLVVIIECSGCAYPIEKAMTAAQVGELEDPKIVAATRRDGSEVRFDTASEDVAMASLEGDTLVAHVRNQVTRIPVEDVETIWIAEMYHDKMWTYVWIGASAVLVSLAIWYTLTFGPAE